MSPRSASGRPGRAQVWRRAEIVVRRHETAPGTRTVCTLRDRLWQFRSEKHRRRDATSAAPIRRSKCRARTSARSVTSPSALITCARPVSTIVAARSSRCGSTRP